MAESFELTQEFKVKPEVLYKAWLNSKEHGTFTETKCVILPTVGGKFVCGDGYMNGINLELEEFSKIIQTWRTVDFPEDAEDSILELLFEPTENGTKLILKHSNIPDGQGDAYKTGWPEHYFKPMLIYYEGKCNGCDGCP